MVVDDQAEADAFDDDDDDDADAALSDLAAEESDFDELESAFESAFDSDFDSALDPFEAGFASPDARLSVR